VSTLISHYERDHQINTRHDSIAAPLHGTAEAPAFDYEEREESLDRQSPYPITIWMREPR